VVRYLSSEAWPIIVLDSAPWHWLTITGRDLKPSAVSHQLHVTHSALRLEQLKDDLWYVSSQRNVSLSSAAWRFKRQADDKLLFTSTGRAFNFYDRHSMKHIDTLLFMFQRQMQLRASWPAVWMLEWKSKSICYWSIRMPVKHFHSRISKLQVAFST